MWNLNKITNVVGKSLHRLGLKINKLRYKNGPDSDKDS